MIQRLNLHIPLNSLSLGSVSFNILRELYRRKIQCVIHPKGNTDLSSYKIDPAFGAWIEQAIGGRYRKVDRRVPTFTVWHLADSHFKPSDKQYLLSFVETDSPQDAEINVVNQQEHTFFSSSWTVDNFRTYGGQNVSFVPLGLDEEYVPAEKRLVSEDVTHWICVGKWEDLRKMTGLKIRAWIKKYGGNAKHQLTLCVTNPFFQQQHMDAVYQQTFQGTKPFNVNVLPYLKTQAEMVSLYQSADCDISGYARNEGWNLPAFIVTALGKWSIVSNTCAHKDWATKDNAILVEPTGAIKAVDSIFFHDHGDFNRGNFYDFNPDDFVGAMEKCESKAKTLNESGVTLSVTHTWKRTVDTLLETISD